MRPPNTPKLPSSRKTELFSKQEKELRKRLREIKEILSSAKILTSEQMGELEKKFKALELTYLELKGVTQEVPSDITEAELNALSEALVKDGNSLFPLEGERKVRVEDIDTCDSFAKASKLYKERVHHPYINEEGVGNFNFDVKKPEREVIAVQFNEELRESSNQAMVDYMDKLGFEPADNPTAVKMMIDNPDLFKKDTLLVSLNSSSWVPSFWWPDSDCRWGYIDFHKELGWRDRFLFVRKFEA